MGDPDRMGQEGHEGISFVEGICDECRHLHEDGTTCDAFPDGIPTQILTGEFDHRDKYPGDGGIQFEEPE